MRKLDGIWQVLTQNIHLTKNSQAQLTILSRRLLISLKESTKLNYLSIIIYAEANDQGYSHTFSTVIVIHIAIVSQQI